MSRAAPTPRRTFLTASMAALVGGGAAGSMAIAAQAADPAFAAVARERAIWAEIGHAVDEEDEASVARHEAGMNRRPCVQVGEYTKIVRGADLDPIPSSEWVAEPVYAYSHAEIDRDCDSHARWPVSCPGDPDARRTRLHAAFDADAAALAASPENVRFQSALEATAELWVAHREATKVVVSTIPATAGGLVAIIDCFSAYTDGCEIEKGDGLDQLLATVRAFVSGRA